MSGAYRPVEPAADVKYRRVLLKISGEALAGESKFGFDFDTMERIAGELQQVVARVSANAVTCRMRNARE